MIDSPRRLTPGEISDITKRWMACSVVEWNTSCADEGICMNPRNPKCPITSGKTEIIFEDKPENQTQNQNSN